MQRVSGRQAPLQVSRLKRTTVTDESACSVDLTPHIPEENGAHPAVLQVADNTFAVPSLPVGKDLQSKVDRS